MNRIVPAQAARAILLTLVFLRNGACDAAEPAAPPQAPAPFCGTLVLHEGGALSGAIIRDGDRYVVTTAASEIMVPEANVELVCHSLEDAYRQQRGQIESPTAESHLELAEWCLRHDLLSEATRELQTARKHDARHPRLRLFERRIAVARETHRATASGTQSVELETQVAAPQPTSENSADQGRFRLLLSDLPKGAVERFTRKVQPLLVNSCTSGGCHQRGSSQLFQLDRSLLHDMANRRSTMQNLTATLAIVDRDRPDQSPLLTVPRRAHGGMEKAVFGPHDAKLLMQLVDWVSLVTDEPPPASLPASEADTADAAQTFGSKSSEAGASEADRPVESAVGQKPITLRPHSRVRYGAQLRPVRPKDEFDPEIFNRQVDPNSAAAIQ
jgi:hypothetical protein